MTKFTKIYILGSGAIGLALGVYLHQHGRDVQLVKTSTADLPRTMIDITIHNRADDSQTAASLPILSLAQLTEIDGLIVITAKAYANQSIAATLKQKPAEGPILLLQNGLSVEQPYLTAGFSDIYRCILYSSSQKAAGYDVQFRSVNSSPIGVIQGDNNLLKHSVELLNTAEFPFHLSNSIQEEIWQKAIINSVFNTVCPLLEVDNGIFARDEGAATIAQDIIRESTQVAAALGISLDQQALHAQVLKLSHLSTGQLISTLQDIRNGRPTEIESLNIEIARLAASLTPSINVPQTKLLGELVTIKSSLSLT